MYDKSLSYGSVICQIAAPIVIEYAQNAIDTFSIVSVIEVQVSSDFSYADVLVTSEKNSADLPAYLAPLAHRIQRAIGKQTAARKVPKIRFRLWGSVANANRVNDILIELGKHYDLKG